MINSAHNPNRSLVRIFCLSLSGLLSVYTAIAVYGLFQLETIDGDAIGDRPACGSRSGLVAVGVLFRWGWLDEPLESQIRLMAASFEIDYANMSTQNEDQVDRSGDDAQPLAGTGDDPLAGLGLPGLFLLQEFHHAGLLPGPWRGLRGRRKAALRAGAGVADAGAVRRRHHAAALRHRRRLSDLLDRLALDLRHAGLFPARRELHHLRLHLLSGGPALRQAAALLQFAQRLQPQSRRQHFGRDRAVRDEPVLDAAGDLVRGDRRHHAAVRAVARRIPERRHRELLRAAGDPGLAGAAGDAADLFAVPVAGAHRQGRRADADPLGRQLLPEGL